MGNGKGARKERELARAFADAGWAVMRSPSSGSATAREQPDLFAGCDGRGIAMEVKASGDSRVYLDAYEVDDLTTFAEAFGAVPRVVVRWDGDTNFYAFRPEDLRRTDSKKYVVTSDACDHTAAVYPDDLTLPGAGAEA